jgi:cyclophilin family peptidyl-prolyl cis-trans isomerase
MTKALYLALSISLLLIHCSPKIDNYELLKDDKAITILQLQDKADTKALIHYLKSKKTVHRTLAAYAFASIQDPTALPYLYLTLLSEKDTSPRRAAAYAIGQIGDSAAIDKLLEGLISESSENNQAVILEAIGKCSNQKAFQFLLGFNPPKTILQFGRIKGIYHLVLRKQFHSDFFPILLSYSESVQPIVQLAAFQTLQRAKYKPDTEQESEWTRLKSSTKDLDLKFIIEKIIETPKIEDISIYEENFVSAYREANNPYHKINLIRQLQSSDVGTFVFLEKEAKENPTISIKTEAASKYFELWPKANLYPERYYDFTTYCLQSNDLALISLAVLAIGDTRSALFSIYKKDFTAIEKAKQSLTLPRDMETLADIEKTLAKLKGIAYVRPLSPYNHKPNWENIKKMPAVVKIKLTTTQGVIIMEWQTEKAPCSVANITELVEAGFYNDKYFHRVVPGFVIQGGCPRGDGWGSLNWTQRSEFSNELKYTRGTVGLASSGKDTEGVQFFITHQATPNLEGRYTILGYVVQGMEVVDKIQIGDKILKMERLP